MGNPDGPRRFADFAHEIRSADLAALHELATTSINEEALSEWARDSASRLSLLGEIAWCSIRWPVSLGQPHTPTFAAAFAVTHEYWAEKSADAGGGIYVDMSSWEVAPRWPLLFPGSRIGDEYVVPMVIYPVFLWMNRLRVELARADWDGPAVEITPLSFRATEPSVQEFKYLSAFGPPVALEDVHVISRPYRLIG